MAQASGTVVSGLPFLPRRPRVALQPDGSLHLWDERPLVPAEYTLVHLLASRAATIADRIFVAKRASDGWVMATYGEMFARARRIASGLRQRGLEPGDRILCLSGEGIDHLALQLGAMLAQLVTVPISVRYSTARDRSRLDHVLQLIQPSMIFADATPALEAALAHCGQTGCSTLTTGPLGLDTLEQEAEPADIDAVLSAINPDTVYRILLTSGSTSMPKGVLQTHRMSCASLAYEASLTTDGAGLRPPEKELSWLPWSHVGGGITVFNNVLYAGRSLYLDDGRPVPGQFDETVRNLKELMPREFSSPPAGLTMLVPELDEDEAFRTAFLKGLSYVKAGAAALPDAVGRRFQAMAIATTGHEIPILSGYGTTETHGIMSLTWPCDRASALGLPKPGVLLKLVPEDDRYEIRVRSDSVTPGYFDAPEATADSVDDDGFFRTGDMAYFDPERPEEGLFFAGRSGENFKMATGTWVLAAELRMALLDTLEGLVSDCLVLGEGQECLGLMVWGGAERRAEVERRMRDFNLRAGAASRRVARLVFSDLPIQEERFERTEKGSLNRNRILMARQVEIDMLFGSDEHAHPQMVVLD